MKCLHLSGFGRERGYGRLNPPAIDSSSRKRYISEEKIFLLSPEGRNRAAGNCLCSLGEHQPGRAALLPPSTPLPAGLVGTSRAASEGFGGIREPEREFATPAAAAQREAAEDVAVPC